MDYARLCKLRDELILKKSVMKSDAFRSFERSFDIEYAHESTALEGNTLTLIETKTILEDRISVGGKPLREQYEVENHDKAFDYVKKCIDEHLPLTENTAKDIHALLMTNILVGGVYRNTAVRITGASHKPPNPSEMYRQIKDFFADLPDKTTALNTIEFAAYTHAEFVKIHPFEDGNGRTSRLLMNYQLMSDNFLPIAIRKSSRLEYYQALEAYAVDGDLNPFIEQIAILEEERLLECLAI
jgi:Fic family protein